jgi:hypothetical protein
MSASAVRMLIAFLVLGAAALLAVVPEAHARHLSKDDVQKLLARCAAAREVRLKPLRDKEIEECVRTAEARRMRKEDCQEFYKDFGNARYTGKGVMPRMFHDLPECQASDEAEDHQRMYPQ